MTSVSGCHGGGWTLVMKIDGSSVRLYGGFVKKYAMSPNESAECYKFLLYNYT